MHIILIIYTVFFACVWVRVYYMIQHVYARTYSYPIITVAQTPTTDLQWTLDIISK